MSVIMYIMYMKQTPSRACTRVCVFLAQELEHHKLEVWRAAARGRWTEH